MEKFVDVKGYEGFYQISSFGRVKNTRTGNILVGDTNSVGYRRVTLYQPIKKRFLVHRLVAHHFCDGYAEGLVVNHKDGNKYNNLCTNLEWVTRSENDLHAFKLGLRTVYPCQFKHKVLCKKNDVIVATYQNAQECAEDLGVARANVYNCCNGKQKHCKGYTLSYC